MLHLSRRAIPGALNGKSNLFIPLLDLSLLITTPVLKTSEGQASSVVAAKTLRLTGTCISIARGSVPLS